VPAILAVFWIVKILTTAFGEACSDWLGDVNVGLGAVVELALVSSALWLQFSAVRYRAFTYWYLAVAIAVFGTGVADTTHQVGLPYAVTSAGWAVALGLVFWRWYRSEGTLSIHSIHTRRREAYYWATIFCTFALGTALGDFTATELNLGFLPSGLLFGGLILLPLVAWKWCRLNGIVAFWTAYVLTRPLGASFSDYISKPHDISGANLGDGWTTLCLGAAVALAVGYLAVTRVDRQPGDTAETEALA
jgi:uncharacterized membrane-anchored protein